MNLKTLLLFFLIAFEGVNCLAQKSYENFADSLLAQGTILKITRSFYIKPIIEQYNSLVATEGDGFSPLNGDLVRKRGLGFRIGYQWKVFEIETGLSTVRPVAGYGFTQNGIYGGYSSISRSTDFYHLPFIFRYRMWQPSEKLSFRIGTGVAYNADLDKLKLSPTNSLVAYAVDTNGDRVILSQTKSQYDQQKSFFSAELNLTTQYQFSRHFHATLEVRRLFGPKNAVRLTAIQEQFDPSSIRTVEAHSGTNSLSINMGLSYHFGSKAQYQLK